MRELIDWFQMQDFFPLLFLALILTFVGRQLSTNTDLLERRSTRFAGVAFLVYGAIAASILGISDSSEAVVIALRALLASALAYGMGSILFSIHLVLDVPLKALQSMLAMPVSRARADKARTLYEKRLKLISKANLSPIEATAARQKAKHIYLKEIDEALL